MRRVLSTRLSRLVTTHRADPFSTASHRVCIASRPSRVASEYSGGPTWTIDAVHDAEQPNYVILSTPGKRHNGKMRIAVDGVKCYVQWQQLPR